MGLPIPTFLLLRVFYEVSKRVELSSSKNLEIDILLWPPDPTVEM